MVTQCCICHAIKTEGGRWFDPGLDENVGEIGIGDRREAVSHGYCPSCFDEALGDLTSYRGRRRWLSAGLTH